MKAAQAEGRVGGWGEYEPGLLASPSFLSQPLIHHGEWEPWLLE